MSGPEVLMADGALKRQGDSLAPQGVVFRAKRTNVQVLGNNAWLDFKPDLKQFDPFGYYDPSTGRFQPKIAGYYRLSGCALQQPGNSTTWTYFRFAKNGGPPNGPAARAQQQQGGTPLLGGSTVMYLNGTTDYATIQVQSDNYAGSAGIYGDNIAEDYSWFEAELIGVSVGVIPEPWHNVGAAGEPAFAAGWSNNYADGSNPARFFKDPHGVVHLNGSIKSTGAGALAFTLPVGYRPNQGAGWALSFWNGSTRVLGVVSIGTDGGVRFYGGADQIVAMQYTNIDGQLRAEL